MNVSPLKPKQVNIPSLADDGGDDHMSIMKERLAKLEGAQDGLKQSQIILLGAAGMVSAILIGLGIFMIQKTGDLSKTIDTKASSLSAKVDNLPVQINEHIQALTQTLSTAITASKQQPPQVILMQAPATPTPSNSK